MWIKEDLFKWMEAVFWGGSIIAYDVESESLCIPGGQDFMMYPAIEESLKLYKRIGAQTVLKRSAYLKGIFKTMLKEVLEKHCIKFTIMPNGKWSPVVTVLFKYFNPYPLYNYLNEQKIHVKCIRQKIINDDKVDILRIGIPYFETVERLGTVVRKLDYFLSTVTEQSSIDFQEIVAAN